MKHFILSGCKKNSIGADEMKPLVTNLNNKKYCK